MTVKNETNNVLSLLIDSSEPGGESVTGGEIVPGETIQLSPYSVNVLEMRP